MEKVPEQDRPDERQESQASIAAFQTALADLFDGYSKLMASMHQWGVKDYFDAKIRHVGLRALILFFLGLDKRLDGVLLEYVMFNRKRTITRIRNECDLLIEPLEDIQRFNEKELKKIEEIRKSIIKYRETIPKPAKGISYGQLSLLITTVTAVISLAIQMSIPNETIVIFYLIGFGELGFILAGLGVLTTLGLMLPEYIWYRLMVRKFEIRKKELVALKALRPLTKQLSKSKLGFFRE